jgi:hypothetical protein
MAREVLLDTELVLLRWDAAARAVIMTRTSAELPHDHVRLRAFFETLVAAVADIDRSRAHFIIDSRDTVGRNDDTFESVKREYEPRLFGGFQTVSVVLKTEIGRLQVQRYSDVQEGDGMRVFATVEDALRSVMDRS